MTDEHPSFLALDGLRLGLPHAAARAHLEACQACAVYVQGEGHGDFQADAPAGPPWLARARLAPPASARSAGWWKRPLLVWPAAVSALALTMALLVPRLRAGAPADETLAAAGTRQKGGPGLGVFIKRGESVFSWDGRAAVRPDDRLRFEVHPSGYRFVSVALRPADGAPPAVLYAGQLPPALSFLPTAFRVDDQGRQEVVSVILSNRPIPARLHVEAGEAPATEAWRQILVFDKSVPDASPARKETP
jgi:hypothetical protein